jgi:2-polyprenyl-6-hydroxyphenyl methylase/3-demethylubiquinone-9 3-methyltransferase
VKTASAPTVHRGKQQVNMPCELCGDARSRLWRTLRYPRFGHPGSFELRCCEGCGLVFNSPRLAPAALGQLYDRNYYVFNEPAEAAFERVARLHHATVAQLELHLPVQGRLLEVGSAKGYMLALMLDRGWKVQGIELSEHAARHANEALHAPTYCGTLEAWAARSEAPTHPAAYTTDVIEHVPSPRRFLQALHQSLEPGALALIGTPNIDSDGVREHGDHWLGFNPFHIWLFSRATLSALLDQCGFDVVDSYSFGNLHPEREPHVGAARRWLRDGLGGTGLLEALRALRSRPAHQPTAAQLAALRSEAGRTLAHAPSWRSTPDGQHPRAQATKGDNLVVIARRRGTTAVPQNNGAG